MNKYRIADMGIAFTSNDDYFYELFKDYREDAVDNIDMQLDISMVDELKVVGEVEVTEKNSIIVTRDGDIMRTYYFYGDTMYGGLWWSKAYEKCGAVVIRGVKVSELNAHDIGYTLLGVLFAYRTTYFGGVVLHGSAIKYHDKAIIFSAPSGVGKSTQAGLWKKVFGEEVTAINDDKPALRVMGDKVHCYGTPFAGKDHINVNTLAEVGAIVNVVRADEDRIERLSTRESLVLLLEEISRAVYNREVNSNNMATIGRILALVPVYRLYCTPTENAVHVAHKVLSEVL